MENVEKCFFLKLLFRVISFAPHRYQPCIHAETASILSRNSLPNNTLTTVNIGIDIKDLPNVNDHDFRSVSFVKNISAKKLHRYCSVTLNGFFLVRWRDPRLIISNVKVLIFTFSSSLSFLFLLKSLSSLVTKTTL